MLLDELIFKTSCAGFGYNEIVLLVVPKSAVPKAKGTTLSKTIKSTYTELVKSNAPPTIAPTAGAIAPVTSHIAQFVVSVCGTAGDTLFAPDIFLH